MALDAAVLPLPLGVCSEREIIKCYTDTVAREKAVRVENGSIIFDPKHMTLDRFYFVELKSNPYLYRKVSEHEVEIYGMAKNY